ncbi:hypothetical protein [Nonomuraea sp. NPDC050310]|uniref:hypothetical protein n=1 Tax=Nonomuraea sp. NPDC050310 TaxID=3154935 RepID=UPI0033D69638
MTSTVLIAADVDAAELRALLADLPPDAPALVRTARVTPELRELQARRGVVLVVGEEHDPRAKEQVSASGLSRLLPDITRRKVRLAGPKPFRRYVRGSLRRLRRQSV